MFLLFGGALAGTGLVAFVLVFDGAGSLHSEVAHDPSGRIERAVTWTFSGSGKRVYWNPDGSLDLDRSHHRWLGMRTTGLSQAEIDLYSSSKYHLDDSFWPVKQALDHYLHRGDGLTDGEWKALTTCVRRDRAPDSLSHLLTYAPSRAALGDRTVLPRDPWGRDYLLAIEPDAAAPIRNGVRVTLYTRGSDGVAGGAGDAADFGWVHDWSGERTTSEIP